MYPSAWDPRSYYGTYPGYGYGMGGIPWFPFFPGWGRGFGRWFGMFPWLYSALWERGYPGTAYPFAPMLTEEQEKQMLEDEMQALQQRMEDISKRLSELG